MKKHSASSKRSKKVLKTFLALLLKKFKIHDEVNWPASTNSRAIRADNINDATRPRCNLPKKAVPLQKSVDFK